MDKIIPIVYLIGVLILVLPSFLSSNNKFKTIITNFSIWLGILLFLMTVYFLYKLYFKM